MRRSPALLAAAVVLAAVAGLMGCGGPSPEAEGAGCAPATDDLVAEAENHLEDGGRLRHGYLTRSSATGTTFLSAELVDDEDESDKGDIYTWTVGPGAGASRLDGVDENARKHSSSPGSAYRPDDEAAMRSRGCTYLTGGGHEFDDDELATCWKLDIGDERRQCDLQARIAREAPPGSAEWSAPRDT